MNYSDVDQKNSTIKSSPKIEKDTRVCDFNDIKKYVLEGIPIPLQRHRFAGFHAYDNQRERKVSCGLLLGAQQKGHALFSGPLKMELIFYFPVPSHMSIAKKALTYGSFHHYKPDIDNLIKFILDVGNNILYEDDSLFVSLAAMKLYDVVPRTEITIMGRK